MGSNLDRLYDAWGRNYIYAKSWNYHRTLRTWEHYGHQQPFFNETWLWWLSALCSEEQQLCRNLNFKHYSWWPIDRQYFLVQNPGYLCQMLVFCNFVAILRVSIWYWQLSEVGTWFYANQQFYRHLISR